MLLAFLSLTSCEEDSLDPLPTKVAGQFVKMDIIQRTMESNFLETTAFRATLSTPGNNIVKYDLFVRRRNPNGFNTSNFVLLKTITSFPHDLVVTPQDIANALGVDRSTLENSDNYRFVGYSYDANGAKAGYNNLAASWRVVDAMKQGYRWTVNLIPEIDPDADPFDTYQGFSESGL